MPKQRLTQHFWDYPREGPSYGVEYTAAQINDVLQKKPGAIRIRHRDCFGHGTHVASTAAGDGRPKHKFVGVAPEADIVVVKLLDLEDDPNAAGAAPPARRFKDAVNYVLNVAKNKLGNRPVVINCSFGSDNGPNDGLTDDELFIDSTFNSAGRAIVLAAGNNGGALHHVKLQSSILAAKEIEFELVDKRPPSAMMEFSGCQWVKDNPPLLLRLWYRDIAPKTMTFEVTLPGVAAPVVAPVLGGAPVTRQFGPGNRQSCQMTHTQVVGGGVKRNSVTVLLSPDDTRYPVGNYKLKITATEVADVHMYFRRQRATLLLKPKSGGSDQFDIGPNAGAKQAITVAAYGAQGAFIFQLAPFSSRGPMVQYDPSPGARPVPPKPDITAPGTEIDAAKSRHRQKNPGERFKAAGADTATLELQGTSMAAPHVTGVVALALSKKPGLTTDQVKSLVRSHFEPMPAGGTADEWGVGKLNAKAVTDSA